MATHALIAALCVPSHALRPTARRAPRRAAPRMLLDVASAGHVIAAATPSLDYATHLAAAPSVDATHLLAAAPVALDYKALATKAIGGGASGALAGVVQVSSLMWLRTAMNYQYRHGGTLPDTLKKLYKDGGIRRFYRGLPFAIFQGPMSRFGSAASNTLVLGLRDADVWGLHAYPLWIVTILGSYLTALYRVALMPIDTLKTVSQVEGRKGFDAVFRHSIRKGNVRNLYTGSYAMFLATLIGHYPWFATYNVLQRIVPRQEVRAMQMLRSAVIGFTASIVSDVTSNPIRVVKTTKQSSAAKTALKLEAPRRRRDGANDDSYANIVLRIAKEDGVQAFFTRGLSTRILANGLQSIVFSVVWRLLFDT